MLQHIQQTKSPRPRITFSTHSCSLDFEVLRLFGSGGWPSLTETWPWADAEAEDTWPGADLVAKAAARAGSIGEVTLKLVMCKATPWSSWGAFSLAMASQLAGLQRQQNKGWKAEVVARSVTQSYSLKYASHSAREAFVLVGGKG